MKASDLSSAVGRRGFLRLVAAAGLGVVMPRRTEATVSATVVLARARNLESVFGTPHYQHILDLLTAGLRALTGEITDGDARRRFFGVHDSLAVQIATSPIAVVPEVVDAVCTTAARAGVPVERMFIYSADEHELYRAGFALKQEGPGVRCYGTRSEGYRATLSRLLGPGVTAIVNVPCLCPDPRVGLAGALRNYLNAVCADEEHDACAEGGARLPSVFRAPALRDRTRLHIMDCLRPAYDLPAGGPPARWDYHGLLLSTDPVALDAVALAILQSKRREVAGRDWPLHPYPVYLQRAVERYGLGTADLKAIKVIRVGHAMDGDLIESETAS